MALAYIAAHRDGADSVVESVTTMQPGTTQVLDAEASDLPPSDGAAETTSGSDLPPAN